MEQYNPTDRRKKSAANRLSKEQMTAVVWTTPLGLPIVQPYRKTKRRQIMTALQTVYISDPNSPAEGEASGSDGYIVGRSDIDFFSQPFKTSHCIPAQLHSQFGRYAHDADCS